MPLCERGGRMLIMDVDLDRQLKGDGINKCGNTYLNRMISGKYINLGK